MRGHPVPLQPLIALRRRFVAMACRRRTLRARREPVRFAPMKHDRKARTPVNTRRAYIDGRYGQMHLRTAFPSTGGFDEHTALVCLHRAPSSSRCFQPLLGEIGSDRSVYAPDTPGFGDSDSPPEPPSVADYAAAIGDFVDALRLREIDLLGHQDGAAIAAELAISRPALVRRLVCVGLPAPPGDGLPAVTAEGTPRAPTVDGSHLSDEWQRHSAALGPGAPLAELAAEFSDRLRAGRSAEWGAAATRGWAAAERLRMVTQATLVLRPRDLWWQSTAMARSWLRAAESKDFADQGPMLLATAPGVVAATLRRFLDR